MRKRILFRSAAILLLVTVLASVAAGAFAGTGAAGVETEELWLERDGKKIFGRLYLPENAVYPLPLLILSNGLGSDHTIMEPYAEFFAEAGFAAYIFDYIGGSENSLSDGKMTEMSVLTEAEDLNSILDYFRGDSRFPENEIFLFGGSQGGFVSSYVAGKRPEDVAGLIVLYPAYNLQEISLAMIAEDGSVPETAVIGEHTVGSVYLEDMKGFDIYEVLRQYTGPALLFHGTEDPYVPLEYVRRAADILSGAELVIVEGAGHGFSGEDRIRVAQTAVEFVLKILTRLSQDASTAA